MNLERVRCCKSNKAGRMTPKAVQSRRTASVKRNSRYAEKQLALSAEAALKEVHCLQDRAILEFETSIREFS